MHEKKNVIHSRNQHEERLRTDTNSLGKIHTQPKIAVVDCAKVAAMDGAIYVSIELDTNF